MKLHIYDIIRRPIVTEKSTNASAFNKVVVEVSASATKPDIKRAFKSIFNVDAVTVNTLILKGKSKRFRGTNGTRSNMKKAIITLAPGQSIDFSAGV